MHSRASEFSRGGWRKASHEALLCTDPITSFDGCRLLAGESPLLCFTQGSQNMFGWVAFFLRRRLPPRDLFWPRFGKRSQRIAAQSIFGSDAPFRGTLVRARWHSSSAGASAMSGSELVNYCGFFWAAASGMAGACHRAGLLAPARVSGTSLAVPVPFAYIFLHGVICSACHLAGAST